MASGYMVKIQDDKGNIKKFYSSRAKSHKQGNSLASALIKNFGRRFPDQGPFSALAVDPSNGGGCVEIDGDRYDDLQWP